MGEGVHTELVSFGENPARQFWVLIDLRADHEERRVRAVSGQDVENHGRPLWIWTVVERQCDRVVRHAAARHLAVTLDTQHGSTADHLGRRWLSSGRRRSGITVLRADVVDVSGQAELAEQDKHAEGEQEPMGTGLAPVYVAGHELWLGGLRRVGRRLCRHAARA